MEPIRYYGTGRRKTASARVWLTPGSGRIIINGREAPEYLRRPILERIVTQPMRLLGIDGQYDIMATVRGAGCRVRRARFGTALRAPCCRSAPNTARC
jgi:ribosomal protein S9